MIKDWPASKVPRRYLDDLWSLTLSDGQMWPSFMKCRQRKTGRVYAYFDRGIDEPIGWLLIRESPPWDKSARFDVQVYVRKDRRNSGIGQRLYRRATKGRGKIAVYPWTEESFGFFYKFRNIRDNSDWIERDVDLVNC